MVPETFIFNSNLIVRIIIFFSVSYILFFCCFIYPKQNRIKERKEEEVYKAIIEDSKRKTDEDLKKSIASKYGKIFQSSEKDASIWAENIVSKSRNRDEVTEELSEKTAELKYTFMNKWQPLYIYIIRQFDTRIDQLQKKGINIKYDKKDIEIITTPSLDKQFSVRSMQFKNEWKVAVLVNPAVIDNGKFSQYPVMRIIKGPKNGTYKPAVLIRFDEKEFSIASPYDIKFKEYEYTTFKDPLEDNDFKNKINSIINELISSVIFY